MTIIKRIIMWIFNFFRKLFGKKNTKKRYSNQKIEAAKKNKLINSYNSSTLPPYMMIDGSDKLALIHNIGDAKKKLRNDNIIKNEIKKIIALMSSDITNANYMKEYLLSQDFNKLNDKKITYLLQEYDINTQEKVYEVIYNCKNRAKIIEEALHNLDEIDEYVKNNNISIETYNLIDNEIMTISEDKEIINNNTLLYNKNVINTIKNWDKGILSEVKKDYQEINYVTISTVLIDQMIEKYQKLEDNYEHHRYNKYYYERELNKIKEQINYLKKIKNSDKVYKEIEILRKELYTKSKDKYDILYNNEIFVNMNKKCDELLNKVNQRVIDIKKEEKTKDDEQEKENKREEYLKKILSRFKDLALSRQLILFHQEKEDDILDYSDISLYIDQIYLEFLSGINDEFNYQRNKTKTELVKLYNDLNNVMSYKNKESHISIDHINFRMEDLVEAVKVKKDEVERIIDNSHRLSNSNLVDEKIIQIKEKFIGNKSEKVLKKTN